MAKINKTYNLPEYHNIRKDADLDPSDPDSINENIKNGITISLYEAGEKASQLTNNWKTLSKQQLHDLLTSLITNGEYDSEHDPDDMKPLDIPFDDYVVNYIEVYAAVRKTTPEQALMIFYNYNVQDTQKLTDQHTATEIDPNKF